MMPLPSLIEIEAAKALIRPVIRETPVYRWPLLEAGLGCELWLKHENHTPVGAFKIRGGLVYLDELKRHEPGARGVIAATTGNHGQSIAFAARRNGLRAVIVVPHGNNPEKNDAMRALGAELVEHGREFQEALEHSRERRERDSVGDDAHAAELAHLPEQAAQGLFLHVIKEHLPAAGARHDMVAMALDGPAPEHPPPSASPGSRGRVGRGLGIDADELVLERRWLRIRGLGWIHAADGGGEV